jgi:hypothetical protein
MVYGKPDVEATFTIPDPFYITHVAFAVNRVFGATFSSGIQYRSLGSSPALPLIYLIVLTVIVRKAVADWGGVLSSVYMQYCTFGKSFSCISKG